MMEQDCDHNKCPDLGSDLHNLYELHVCVCVYLTAVRSLHQLTQNLLCFGGTDLKRFSVIYMTQIPKYDHPHVIGAVIV